MTTLPSDLHPTSPNEQQEPCPTPLNWVDVVTSIESECQRLSVEVQGGEMLATVHGSGPPLYFLGGASGTARLFDLTAHLLKEEFTCVMLSPVTWSARPIALLDQTADGICRLANSLGHQQFDLYAAGFGCHVAISMLSRSPDRIGRVLLQGPVLREPTRARERLLYWLGQKLSRPMYSLPGWLQVQEQNHQRYFPPLDPTRYNFLIDELGATPVQQVAYRNQASSQADWRNLFETVQVPVMLVRCEGEGMALAKLSDEFAASLGDCRSEMLHSAGHFPYLTHPNRLVKIIKPFLDS